MTTAWSPLDCAKPAVIVYRLGWLSYHLFRPLINVRYITLVNLLASNRPLLDRRIAEPRIAGAPSHAGVRTGTD